MLIKDHLQASLQVVVVVFLFAPHLISTHICLRKFADGSSEPRKCTSDSCEERGWVDPDTNEVNLTADCAKKLSPTTTYARCTHSYYRQEAKKKSEADYHIFHVSADFLIYWRPRSSHPQAYIDFNACCNSTIKNESCNAHLLTRERLQQLVCQRPHGRQILKHCEDASATTSKPITPPTTTPSSPSSTDRAALWGCGVGTPLEIGSISFAVGTLLGVVIGALVVCCIRRRQRRTTTNTSGEHTSTTTESDGNEKQMEPARNQLASPLARPVSVRSSVANKQITPTDNKGKEPKTAKSVREEGKLKSLENNPKSPNFVTEYECKRDVQKLKASNGTDKKKDVEKSDHGTYVDIGPAPNANPFAVKRRSPFGNMKTPQK